ncbi:MAG: hypothetical protein J7L89_02240, partial [Bacteroidales bacterium]|nr:hypothetical protein [Bacteroidales bacterium]
PVVARSYEPSLTMKVALRHNFRSLVRIMAGIAMDTLSTKPEHILEFPMFNFQGGSYPFFDPEGADTTRFELGLDLTPLLSYARKDQSARIFLIVDEKDMSSEMGSGKILSMTLYNHFGVEDSVTCKGLPLEIANDSRTLASVVKILHFNEIKVTPPPVVYTRPDQYVSEKLEVTGAANPFSW